VRSSTDLRPTLALIDLTMPGSQGHEHLIETINSLPGVPVIVISGSEDPALMRALLMLGVQGFIPKAYSPDVMLSAVRLVLSGGVYVPPMLLLDGGAPAAAIHAEPAPASRNACASC
jgi:Response regulator containing a CheY-like receiver domain and an HTH DNA-binding domain